MTIHDNIMLQNYIKYISGIYLSISYLKYLWKIYATFVLQYMKMGIINTFLFMWWTFHLIYQIICVSIKLITKYIFQYIWRGHNVTQIIKQSVNWWDQHIWKIQTSDFVFFCSSQWTSYPWIWTKQELWRTFLFKAYTK